MESVLLYGSETWTMAKKLEKSVNGCYARTLRTALNVHWQQHVNNEELYRSPSRISETIRTRYNEETSSKVLLWEPQHGHPNRGRPRTTYIETIKADAGLDNTKEIRDAILNQVVWKHSIRRARDNFRAK